MPQIKRVRPQTPARAGAAPNNLKPMLSTKEESDSVLNLVNPYDRELKRRKQEFAKAEREGNSQKAQEYWAKVKKNCEEDRNKTFADFVVVLVDMIRGSYEASKAIKASLKGKSAAFDAWHNPIKAAKDAIVNRKKDVDPNESAKGIERVIGTNLNITLDQKGELTNSLTIRGQEIKDLKMKEALDTMVMSYFQEEGFDFEVPPGSTKPRVVYSPDHPRCQAGAAKPVAVGTPIERADFDKLVENHNEAFKKYAQEILDRPVAGGNVRGARP